MYLLMFSSGFCYTLVHTLILPPFINWMENSTRSPAHLGFRSQEYVVSPRELSEAVLIVIIIMQYDTSFN